MSKQLLEIRDFSNWIINDETAWATNGFVDMSWIDIWTKPWVAQLNFRLENDTTSWLNENVLSFTTFDDTILAWMSWAEIWKNSWTSWTLDNTNANIWNNNDLITYQNYLIYASRTKLWRSTTTAIWGGYTDNPTWGSGTTFLNGWSDDLHFFKEFNNRLYISDGNVIAELDWASSPTTPWAWIFTNNKFILPENEQIRSMEVIWSSLAIWTLIWNFYLWDGVSVNASQIIKTNLWGIHSMLQLENTLYVFAGIDGTVYRYNGADLIPEIQIPNFRVTATSYVRKPWVRKFKNGMIFCIEDNWIFVYNRVKQWDPFSLNRYGNLSSAVVPKDASQLNAIYITNINTTNDRFIIWYSENWDKIDRVSWSNRYRMEEAWLWDTSVWPYIETEVYELRDSKWQPNKVQWVQALFTQWTNTFPLLRVEYRTDTTDNYTLLGRIWQWWWIDVNKILRWIWKRVHRIQFKFKMWWSFTSTTDNVQLIWIKIF